MSSRMKIYESFDELRRDRERLGRRLTKEVAEMEQELKDCFMPADKSMINSEVSYIRYAGYGITAYKTFNIVRKVVGFIKKKRRI